MTTIGNLQTLYVNTSWIDSGGTAGSGSEIRDDQTGQLTYLSGVGSFSGLVIPSGAQVNVLSGGLVSADVLSGLEYVFSGGRDQASQVVNAGMLVVSAGGEVDQLVVSSGGSLLLNGVASGLTLVAGGVNSAGVVDGAIVRAGSGASIAGVGIGSGATLYLSGSADGVNVAAGGVLDLAAGASLGSGEIHSGGIAGGLVLSTGSISGSGGFTLGGLVVDSGAQAGLELRAGTSIAGFIESGGQLVLDAGARGSNLGIVSGGSVLISGQADHLDFTSATGMIESGGSATGLTLDAGSRLTLFAGASVSQVSVESGATLNLSALGMVGVGSADQVQVASGATVNGLLLTAGNVDAGGNPYRISGVTVASGAVVGLEVAATATIDNLTVVSGGQLNVDSGGTAIGGTLASLGSASNSGSVDGMSVYGKLYNYASDSKLIINSGGVEMLMAGSSVDATVNAQGQQWVEASASGTVVNSGGYQDVYGESYAATIHSGGLQVVEGIGGIYGDLIQGGEVDDNSGVGGSQSLSFSGPGGALVIEAPGQFSAVVSGFGAGNQLILPFNIITRVSWANGILSVATPDNSQFNIAMPGAYQNDTFTTLGLAPGTTAITLVPYLSAAAYDAGNGVLTLSGLNLNTAVNAYTAADFTLTGDGGHSYTLTTGSALAAASSNGIAIQLSAADQLAVNGLCNHNGLRANDGHRYNIAIDNAALAGNGVPAVTNMQVGVGDVHAPTLTAVTYDAGSGVFNISGANLTAYGDSQGLQLGRLHFGCGGKIFTFSPGNDSVSHFSAGGFSISLDQADQALVNAIASGDGQKNLKGTSYTVSAQSHWDGDTGPAATRQVSVSGVTLLAGATYDAGTGMLTLTGSALPANTAVYQVDTLTLKGDHGGQYTLSADDTVTAASASQITIALSAADRLAVDGLLNDNGGHAANGSAYQLAAAAGWLPAGPAQQGLAISVGDVRQPVITAVSYDASAGVLSFSGANLVNHGTAIGIHPASLKFGVGAAHVLFSQADSIGNLDGNGFSLRLSGGDRQQLDALVNADGGNSLTGAAYQLSLGKNWDSGIGAAASGLAINAGNVQMPSLTAVSYDAAAGVFSIQGKQLLTHGPGKSLVLTDFSLSAGTGVFNFHGSDHVSALGSGGFRISLSHADRLAVDLFVNANGTHSQNGAEYGFNILQVGWNHGGGDIADSIPVSVGGVAAAAATSEIGLIGLAAHPAPG